MFGALILVIRGETGEETWENEIYTLLHYEQYPEFIQYIKKHYTLGKLTENYRVFVYNLGRE